MAVRVLKRFNFRVRGLKWQAHIMLPEEFVKVEGVLEDTEALADEEKRTIFFKTTCLNRVVIRHEIVHAFIASMHLTSANLSGIQMEEVFAEFLSRNVEEYIKVCDMLYGKISAWEKQYLGKTKSNKKKRVTKKTKENTATPNANPPMEVTARKI